MLSGREANDGQAEVQLPELTGNDARIIVKAHDNLFFDMSNFKFTISNPTKATAYLDVDKYYSKVCLPAAENISIKTRSIANYAGKIKFVVGDVPEGVTASFASNEIDAGQTNALHLEMINDLPSGFYSINYWAIT